ncbi:MAG: ABC transporter permease, partial [Pseudomonadota bacterium]|nr:ABC transporter permease [Pseudomonadota bacterium]MEC8181344.1 ABC transporter permease [Pseudomonadota bacterium]MEC9176949.1 ABC transporter permease [Pseudomonadota bacterium]
MAEVKLDAPAVEAASGPLREVARMFLKNHAAVGALAVLLLIVAAAVIGPPLYSDDPYEMVWAPFSPPGADGFLLGTDYLGRDILAGLFYGARVSLAIGLSAALMSVGIGVTIGALAGFYR